MEHKIIHIDMDAFFASVEQRNHPELRGLAIAVGHDGPRGVVATASYEARRFGVHSAQAVATAKRLCPQLIIVPGDYAVYKQVSAQMHEIFHEYTDIIEPISLDEAFLDVTMSKTGQTLAMDIAREIKDKIRARLHLTASAGVSYCKLLAKIASDMNKPDGLTVIHPKRALDFIAQLRVEKLWGVGPRTAGQLHRLGIFNGADLRAHSLRYLTDHFGKMGVLLYDFARGIDNRAVETSHERKSVGCEQTYESDLTQEGQLLNALDALTEELMRRLGRTRFEGLTLTLKVKYADFQQITRSLTLSSPLSDRQLITSIARQLLAEPGITERPIRLMGLSVSNPLHATDAEALSNEWTQLLLPFQPWEDE